MDIATLVNLLIGGGALAIIAAFFQGIKSLREGANAKQREAIKDLEKWRDEAEGKWLASESRNSIIARDRDFFRAMCGRYVQQIYQCGGVPDPEEPIPPSERTQ